MPVKTSVLGLMVLGALLVLAACNGDGGDSGATPTSETTPTVVPSPPAEFCPKIDGEVVQSVVALLELDKQTYQYAQGEPIDMTLRLVNCASQPITRSFPDAQRYDFAAKIQDGDEVWRWSSGMDFAQVLGEETYQPGEQLTFSETWDQVDSEGQQVEPGQYELTTESTGCDESLQSCGPTASLFIEITAP
jgi:surface antigen